MQTNWAPIKLLSLLITGLFASQLHAAGIAIAENSGSGLGNAFAGGAAVSEDASVVWFNPAAMSKLQGSNLTGVLNIINTSSHFNDSGSTKPVAIPGAGDSGNFGGTFVVPNVYLTLPMTNQLSFGLGINAPVGLSTEYDPAWIGRAQAVNSEIKSLNVNPALSWKINEMVSLGAGVNYQKLDATLTSVHPTANTEVKLSAGDTAYGYNAGILLSPTSTTQIGFHYRSAIKYDLRGRADFSGAAAAATGDIKVSLKIPSSYSLSALQKVNDQWDLMADVTRTNWSSINELRYIYVNSGTVLSTVPLNWKDTWRYSVGGNYKLNEKWKLRAGVAFDQTPVPDTAHTIARLPDGDRTWLSFGGQYAFMKNLKLDLGYTYIHMKTAHMDSTSLTNSPSSPGAGTLVGNFKTKIHILSAQLNYQF